MVRSFELVAPYAPAGDQPTAIAKASPKPRWPVLPSSPAPSAANSASRPIASTSSSTARSPRPPTPVPHSTIAGSAKRSPKPTDRPISPISSARRGLILAAFRFDRPFLIPSRPSVLRATCTLILRKDTPGTFCAFLLAGLARRTWLNGWFLVAESVMKRSARGQRTLWRLHSPFEKRPATNPPSRCRRPTRVCPFSIRGGMKPADSLLLFERGTDRPCKSTSPTTPSRVSG